MQASANHNQSVQPESVSQCIGVIDKRARHLQAGQEHPPYGHHLFVIERNGPDRRMAPVKFQSGRKARLQVLERKEFTGDGAGGDGWRACEPNRSGAGAARKVPVDRADGYLFGID